MKYKKCMNMCTDYSLLTAMRHSLTVHDNSMTICSRAFSFKYSRLFRTFPTASL